MGGRHRVILVPAASRYASGCVVDRAGFTFALWLRASAS
jgi:hypothetical protein